jgi:hypothetical protein
LSSARVTSSSYGDDGEPGAVAPSPFQQRLASDGVNAEDDRLSLPHRLGGEVFIIGHRACSALFAAIYKILPDNPIAYYSAQIFLLGAEYTRAYAEAHGSQAANR